MIAGRMFLDSRYMLKHSGEEQYIVIFSSNGNEQFAANYAATHDLGGSALAHSVISGHWYMPMYNSSNQLVGTKIFYLNQADFGGNVP